MTKPEFVSLNGKVVAYDDARVHVMTPALRYAFNVFEGIRGYWNADRNEMYIFRLDDHLNRLQWSMRFMRYEEVYAHDYLRACLMDVIKANAYREDIHVLMMAYMDGDGEMTASGPIGLAVIALAGRRDSRFETGMTCQVGSWARIGDNAQPPRVKSVANYHNGRLGWVQARADGYDSVIFLTAAGKVSEGPGACVFIVRDGVPVTPSVTSGILESITRESLIELLDADLDRPVVEREVDRTELYGAAEAFFCGTRIEVAPIVEIDRYALGDGGPGPLTRELRARYLAVARGDVADRPEWRTPVYEA